MSLIGKTLFITGASRGIGLAIAKRAAQDGANIVIAAKTDKPHPKLEGTIHTAAEEIEAAGGKALPLVVDIRDDSAVEGAMAAAASQFGGIDILVNNASAIQLLKLENIQMKRIDLMMDVNMRGTLTCSKHALPYLKNADNPHILVMSPPLDFQKKWFAGHTAYTMAKYGMSMAVYGLSAELARNKIAVNALWPRSTIATAAVQNLLGGDAMVRASRTPDILADAAHLIFQKPSSEFTGQFVIDDTFLAENGVTDFSHYRVDPSQALQPDFFVPDDDGGPDNIKGLGKHDDFTADK